MLYILHAIYYNHFDLPRARAHTHTHTHTLRKFAYTKVLVSAGPCSKCKAGDAAGGGVPLDSNGRCAFFCSPKGYCGKSQAQWAKEGKRFSNAYGVGTDCSASGDRTHTHEPNTHGHTDTRTLNTQTQTYTRTQPRRQQPKLNRPLSPRQNRNPNPSHAIAMHCP